MYPRTLNREKSSYLVLSVILHFVLFAFIHKRINYLPQFVQETEEKKEFPLIMPFKEVAALKPRASEFGVPVIFQEEPTLQNVETLGENATQPELQDLQKSEESTTQESTPQELTPQKILASEEASPAESSMTISQKTEPVQESSPRTQPISQEQKKIVAKEETYQPSNHTKSTGPIARQLTFADLAKGFIQTIKNEGEDFFERKGNENIRPDLEEMKLISYKQKVVWFIQNAFRICYDQEPFHPETIVKCCTIMALNDDGTIRNLQLVYSTGVQAFDTYYLQSIKSAAPFPPIPQHIKKPFVFPFTMVYYTRPKNMAALRRPPLMRFSAK